MATVKEIYQVVDRMAPFATQEGFDNAGFLVGRGGREVKRILVALDITLPVVEEAVSLGAQLIVSHHPVIFHAQKSLTDETVTGRILLALAEGGVAAICAHTNLDAARGGVNDCLARRLQLGDIGMLETAGQDAEGRPYGIGRTGTAHESGLGAQAYARFVKERLQAASVRFEDAGHPVCRVAVGGGSCGSMLKEALAAGCDTFVTADVKYDQYLEARAMGITLLDAGHFATENVVVPKLTEDLRQALPETEVVISQVHREVYGGV